MTSPHTAAHPEPQPIHAEQGYAADAGQPAVLRHAVELAVNYRGDVSITRVSGGTVEGYVFDARVSADPGQFIVRMICKNGGERLSIALADIRQLVFTGKDTAAGKSFETWVKKYVQKKLAGESAGIESEPLE